MRVVQGSAWRNRLVAVGRPGDELKSGPEKKIGGPFNISVTGGSAGKTSATSESTTGKSVRRGGDFHPEGGRQLAGLSRQSMSPEEQRELGTFVWASAGRGGDFEKLQTTHK